MNLPAEINSAKARIETRFAEALHPVHRMQERLRVAYQSTPSWRQAENQDCIAVLNRFLAITGWAQGARRVFESMPHADSVNTVAAFRTVLLRLGFETTVEALDRKNLRAEFLPCFLCGPDGGVRLIESIAANGQVQVFDASTGQAVSQPVDDLEGLAVYPEKLQRRENAQGAATTTWSSQVLTAFAPLIRQIFFISFVVNLLAMLPPVFVMSVYDKAIGSKSVDVLAGLTIGIMLVVVADFALREVRGRLQAYLGARLDEQLNETAFRHLLHLPLSFTEDAPIGSQLTRLRQMTSLHEAFTGPLASALFDLPFVALFLIVIAAIGGHLVWAPIALIVVYVMVAAWAGPRTAALLKTAGESRALLNNLTVEAVSTHRAISDLGAEHVWLKRQRKLSAEAGAANMKSRQLNFLLQTFSQAMVQLAGVSVLAIGVTMVIDGKITGGALIAVMALSWRVLGPIRNLFLTSLTLGQTIQSIQQVDRLVKMPLERDPLGGPTIPREFKGRITFDKIVFRYAGQREPTLRGVSFEARPGQLVCLYGQAGAGVSTVLRVLLGLHQQQAGAIFIDGLDLRQIDKGEWRHAIGVGLQALDLFHGTVAQNIRLARPDATDAELDALARRLGIDRYYGAALPEGLETRCTTMARTTWPDALTNRIILARAFIKSAPIYLLDEPAATLDHEGERALLSILEEKRKTSAIIMTTQRPSHMRLADTVVWMERGLVREKGPPDQIVPKILGA